MKGKAQLGGLLYLLGSISYYYSAHGATTDTILHIVACTLAIFVLMRFLE